MRTRFLHITILITITLAVGCKKEPTSWNTNYLVPLVDGQMDPSFLFDEDIASENPDSSIQIKWVKEIVDYSIDSLYDIPDTSLVKNFNIQIPSITAPAGFQFFTDNDDLEFDVSNGVQLREVGFNKGEIVISINNPVETDIIATLNLPGVIKNGSPLIINRVVPKFENGVEGTFDTIIQLDATIFDLTGSTGNVSNSLASNISLQSDPNGPQVTILSSDIFKTTISLNDLQTNYAKGYFGQHSIDVNDHVIIEFLKNFTAGSLDLNDLDFKITIKNGFKLIASANTERLEGFNTRYGGNVEFTHPQIGQNININPAINSWDDLIASEYNINITDINSNVLNFISILPDSIDFDVNATINPLGNVSGGNDVAYPLSRFIVEADLEFPAKLSMNQITFSDTLDISFEHNIESSHINELKLQVNTINSLPLNGQLALVLLKEDGTIETIDEQIILASPDIDNNGKTIGTTENQGTFTINSDQVMHLSSENTRIILKATMETSNGEEQTFYTNQSLKYSIKGNAGIHLSF